MTDAPTPEDTTPEDTTTTNDTTPEDTTPEDATPEDAIPQDITTKGETPLDEAALDDLDEQARRAEQHAKEAGILPDDNPKFHESGDIAPDLDDQTITPPG